MTQKLLLLIFLILSFGTINAQRKMEKLGRGVVATRTGTSSILVSWRLFGNDPIGTGFNLYRSTDGGTAVKVNTSVLTGGTNYTDNSADLTKGNAYFVKPVINGIEQIASGSFTLTANHVTEPCVVVPLRSGNTIHLVWVGDLDGDGEYDYVVDRLDYTNGGCKIEGYKRDGTFLWEVDLGPNSKNMDNIEPGSSTIDVGNWDGVTVYDMDGDGKAEVMVRTANGVVFGDGTVLTNADNNIQFISVLNGLTGAERARIQIPTDYISQGPLACSMGIGYLDGISPSLVTFMKNRNSDGSFNRLMCAYDFNGTAITLKWKNNLQNAGSDGHQMRIMDFDGDGKDDVGEIGFVLKNDGSLLYNLSSQGIYHGDRWHVGKLDPNRPGMQGYGIQQDNSDGLIEYYYDAGTGKMLWKHTTINVGDAARGEAGDIDPDRPGYEVWSFSGLYNAPSNTQLASFTPYPNFRIWWDGDVLSENYNDRKIEKWNPGTNSVSRLATLWNYHSATGSDRDAPMFYGDILGDWREEVIVTNNDYSQLLIFTTPYPTDTRLYTLPHNPEYRNSMTVKGYLQSHMLDYFLGANMTTPPTPPMQTAKCVWKGNNTNNVWDASTTPNWIVNGVSDKYSQGDDVLFDLSGSPDTLVQLTGTLTPSYVKVITPVNYSFGGSGSVSGSTGLLKSGIGALSINTTCDYTDTTRVEQGTLYVNSSLSKSPVLVSFGAALGGSGTLSSVALNKGAILSPGAKTGTGTLTFSSALLIPANSSCLFDITDDSTGLTKPSDKIVIKGNLTIQDTLTIQVNKINGKVKAGTYPLISYSGTFSGSLGKIGVSGLFGQKFSLVNTNGVIYLKVESARGASKVVWNGSSDTWDLQTTPAWNLKSSPVTFVPGDTVVFDQNGSNNPIVKISGTMTVGDISVETSSNNYTFTGTGNLGGSASLTKSGQGTLSLLNTNSYTGKTVVNSGKLVIANLADAGVSSSIGADTAKSPSHFILNNAYLKYAGSTNISTNKGLTINGASDTLEVTTSGKLMTLQGLITGTANLVITGNGTVNFQKSSNTFAGNTIIKGGTLSLGDETANTNGVNTGSVTLDGGTLTMYSSSSTYTNFYTNLIVPAGSTGTFNTDIRCNYRGTLTGGGTLNVYLPGNIDRTIFFGDWSAFTGNIKISGVASSSFRIANSSGFASAAIDLDNNVNMYHGGSGTNSGDAVATTVNVGAVSGASGSKLSGENWVVGSKNTDATFAGQITGNSITKVGTGSWTLSNANTYTGGTIVNGGTLMINNTSGSGTGTGSVTVNSGAVLAGTGSMDGQVSINTGGTIAPGNNGIGTLVINNNLVLGSNSTTTIEINRASSVSDTIRVTGNITFNGTLNLQNVSSSSYGGGQSFRIFKAASYNGSFTALNPATPGNSLAWDTTSLRINGTIKVKSLQTLNFDPLSEKTFGDASFTLSATSASGLPVTFTSSDPTVVTISGNTATVTGAGTAVITASQSDGITAAQTFIVHKANQVITFGELAFKKTGDAPFSLSAVSSSGLAVTYESSNTSVATINGSTLTIVGSGSANIKASQSGNKNYEAAPEITRALNVTNNTAVDTWMDQEIRVAPNPVVSNLRITLNDMDSNSSVEIYSMSGVRLLQHKMTGKNVTISMEAFQSGMYIVRITMGEKCVIKQIVKL